MTEIVNAAVAVLLRSDGYVLLGQRPEGKSWAGWWEFPGGKIEDGETAEQGLQRELYEELGVRATDFSRWITRVFSYPERTVKLHFFLVRAWTGEPYGREGQLVSWQSVINPEVGPLLPANAPVLEALKLPPLYAITNLAEMGEAAFFSALQKALEQGLRMIQVREKQLSRAGLAAFVGQVVTKAKPYGVMVLVNGDADLARAAGANGVHLTSSALMALDTKPKGLLCGASCHSAMELEKAAQLGLDYCLLGAVLPTLTHPDALPLGWAGFEQLIMDLPMPVYALGGLRPEDLSIAWRHGAHGVALMRAAWE